MSRLEVVGLVKTLGERRRSFAFTRQRAVIDLDSRSAVLRGVDLTIQSGECVGLRGATGSGKSTLLRLIAGLSMPDSGTVLLDGEIISTPASVRPPGMRQIGMVFQNLGLWPHLTVQGHLDFVLAVTPLSKAERDFRRQEILDTFLLSDLRQRYPSQLSGGERHLLALARAFCGEIRLLLMDEPFNGLDGILKQRILVTLNKARIKRGLTALLVSHDPQEMRTLCQRVEQISEGRILEKSRREVQSAENTDL